MADTETSDRDAEIRERGRIEGDLGEWLSQEVWDHYTPLSLGSDYFEPLYAEEAGELGYGEDDPIILLRRRSDGQVFEVEIDVTAKKTGKTVTR